MPFTEVADDQAFLKYGALGLNGSGKSYSAGKFAIGLRNLLVAKKLMDKAQPVYFCDTETGVTWLKPLFAKAGVKLQADKSRSFSGLMDNMDEVAKHNGIMIIDSITHFWRELCDTYQAKKGRKLRIDDWQVLKGFWGDFTDRYVNQPAHYLMNGRQGYEYEIGEDDDGKKKVEKTAIKMKAETETGYEPSILVAFERHQSLGLDGKVDKVWREMFVLKDRSGLIDGHRFQDPDFDALIPHINMLNLGGAHVGVDTTRTSEKMLPGPDTYQGTNYEHTQREILCQEIEELLKSKWPSKSGDDHAHKLDMCAKYLKSRSWLKIQQMDVQVLKNALNLMHIELNGVPAPGCEELPTDGSGDQTDIKRAAKEAF